MYRIFKLIIIALFVPIYIYWSGYIIGYLAGKNYQYFYTHYTEFNIVNWALDLFNSRTAGFDVRPKLPLIQAAGTNDPNSCNGNFIHDKSFTIFYVGKTI